MYRKLVYKAVDILCTPRGFSVAGVPTRTLLEACKLIDLWVAV
jgi:hypothetical protein